MKDRPGLRKNSPFIGVGVVYIVDGCHYQRGGVFDKAH
jgi:hypothetical protein